MHSELRMHPRMPTELSASLKLPDGNGVDVTVRNISLGGVMLEGGDQMQSAIKGLSAFPIEVDLHFQLEGKTVYGRYRLIHTARRRQDLFHMGFMALTMDDTSTHLITRLLEKYESGLSQSQTHVD